MKFNTIGNLFEIILIWILFFGLWLFMSLKLISEIQLPALGKDTNGQLQNQMQISKTVYINIFIIHLWWLLVTFHIFELTFWNITLFKVVPVAGNVSYEATNCKFPWEHKRDVGKMYGRPCQLQHEKKNEHCTQVLVNGCENFEREHHLRALFVIRCTGKKKDRTRPMHTSQCVTVENVQCIWQKFNFNWIFYALSMSTTLSTLVTYFILFIFYTWIFLYPKGNRG